MHNSRWAKAEEHHKKYYESTQLMCFKQVLMKFMTNNQIWENILIAHTENIKEKQKKDPHRNKRRVFYKLKVNLIYFKHHGFFRFWDTLM